MKAGIHFLSSLGSGEKDTMKDSLRNKLLKESAIVAEDSMAVLEEFGRFEEDLFVSDFSIWDRLRNRKWVRGKKNEKLSKRTVV